MPASCRYTVPNFVDNISIAADEKRVVGTLPEHIMHSNPIIRSFGIISKSG